MNQKITLHLKFFETLFAHQGKVSQVFKDVLGLYAIDHMAISYVNANHELISCSSTPSLEFNLFNSPLWCFDRTYHPEWYRLGKFSLWQSLYLPQHYDKLYYLKQIKHHFALGASFSTQYSSSYLIYSLASHNASPHIYEQLKTHEEDLNKIFTYCRNALLGIMGPELK